MENMAKNVFCFAFPAGEDTYDSEYPDNAVEWQRLLVYYHTVQKNTGTDGYYFLIESSIYNNVTYNNVTESDLSRLNQATFRGSIIRSQLKLRLGISSDRIAFCINRSGKPADKVQVTLIRQPMPPAINKDIFYSLGNSRQDISRALQRYPEIPYYDLYYYEEKTGSGDPAETVTAEPEKEIKKEIRKEPEIVPTNINTTPQANPFNIGIKTNLIPWMGLVPSWSPGGEASADYAKGAMMYNGALEYYFSGCASVELSFLYAYTSYGGRTDNLWGISQLTLEPRFWFRHDNRFRGWNAGLRLGYGDFDMRIRQPEKYGKTGRFYSAAFSLGYTLPVYRSLLVEGSVYGGYRNLYNGKDYRVDDGDRKNYFENGFTGGSWMVGVSLNLLFRIGFR